MTSPLHFPGMTLVLGPLNVSYTDIPLNGDTKTIYAINSGDILLQFFENNDTQISWSRGTLSYTLGGISYTSFTTPVVASTTKSLVVTYTNHIYNLTEVNASEAYATAPTGWNQCANLAANGNYLAIDGTLPTTKTVELRAKNSSATQQPLVNFSNFWLGTDSSGNAVLSDNSNVPYITTAVSLTDNSWHSIALALTPGSFTKLYIDGTLAGTTTDAAVESSFLPVEFGHDSNDELWAGLIDEIAVSSTTQYSGNYTPATSPFSANRAGLISLYHLDSNLYNSVAAPAPTQGSVDIYLLISRLI